MAEACTGVICSNFMEASTPRTHVDKAGRIWDQAPAAMGAGDASVDMPSRCRKREKKLQVEKAHWPCGVETQDGSDSARGHRLFFLSLYCQCSAEHRLPG